MTQSRIARDAQTALSSANVRGVTFTQFGHTMAGTESLNAQDHEAVRRTLVAAGFDLEPMHDEGAYLSAWIVTRSATRLAARRIPTYSVSADAKLF
jgi:hypothetical protein